MHSGLELNKNFYNRPKTVGNHGNMSPFYMNVQEKKYKVIGGKQSKCSTKTPMVTQGS